MSDIPIKIYIKTIFEFAHEQNARNVAIALCSSGYLVKIMGGTGNWILMVYTSKNPAIKN